LFIYIWRRILKSWRQRSGLKWFWRQSCVGNWLLSGWALCSSLMIFSPSWPYSLSQLLSIWCTFGGATLDSQASHEMETEHYHSSVWEENS
jgi:hypothetical protein